MKIKPWSAAARKWVKKYGIWRCRIVQGADKWYGLAGLLDVTPQHAGAMSRGTVVTTLESARTLARESGLSVHDFGQPKTKGSE